jgi:glucokinase
MSAKSFETGELPFAEDPRIVMTLDAGGTNFRFSAMQGNKLISPITSIPAQGDDLQRCLNNIRNGFEQVRAQCPEPPIAISFAFPGPSDFPNGIIGDLWNLPGFRGGVPLGAILEQHFRIPVFLNNDGDLFVYGEALAGFLPHVNSSLAKAGSPKRFRNLFGVTLGTGFGGGIVSDGRLLLGDNSMGAEVWLMRHKLDPRMNAEEGASIRGLRRTYGLLANLRFEEVPEPKVLAQIAAGQQPGDAQAAREAFRSLGEVVGDAMAQALTLVDGLGVVGGGISGAWPFFLPAIVAEINGTYLGADGQSFPRLGIKAFNFEEPVEREEFLRGSKRELRVPGSDRVIQYDPLQRTAIGVSCLGTSEAVAVGAYAFALRALDDGVSRAG